LKPEEGLTSKALSMPIPGDGYKHPAWD